MPSDGEKLSACRLATKLMSLPCSLTADQSKLHQLLPMIAFGRHRISTLRAALLFILLASISASLAQLLSVLIFQPPLFAIWHSFVFVLFYFPFLGLSLLNSKEDPKSSLSLTTPKQENLVSKKVVYRALLSFAVKFLPTVLVTVVMYSLMMSSCLEPKIQELYLNYLNATAIDDITLFVPYKERHTAANSVRSMVSIFYLFYTCIISCGFVEYRFQMWQKVPFRNIAWIMVCMLLLLCHFILVSLESGWSKCLGDIDAYLFILLVVWCVPLVVINETLKYYEIKMFKRDQRRRKLSFGTKLGMNSPLWFWVFVKYCNILWFLIDSQLCKIKLICFSALHL